MQSLIDTGWGYHLRSSEYENRQLSTFPFHILHFTLVAPTESQIATNPIANINHIEPPSWEGALSWVAINHSVSTGDLFY
jgi:hypothetical protein